MKARTFHLYKDQTWLGPADHSALRNGRDNYEVIEKSAYDKIKAREVLLDKRLNEESSKNHKLKAKLDKNFNEWMYCPECGSSEIHYQDGEHKQCNEIR